MFVIFLSCGVDEYPLFVDEDSSPVVYEIQVGGMCVHSQEITLAGTRILVKDRKKAHAMEEEVLSRGKANHIVTLEI